jgi:preprotein translocase subunit SecG
MENVVLIIHLLLALSLIGVVLLQRSEGGGLGMGGGGAMTGRAAATALGKVTWGLAVAFICTSIALTVIAAQNAGGASVIDTVAAPVADPATETPPATPATPDLGTDLLPPATDTTPLVPPAN